MKTYYILAVELVDFNAWKNYDGAEAFEDEFKPFAESRLNYKFYNATDLDAAEKRLTALNLVFKRFYGAEIEAEAEIKNHPAFYVTFSSQYDTVTVNDGKLSVNSKKMKSINFQEDTKEETFVVTEKAKTFLETQTTGFTFELLSELPKPFYQLTTIPELHFPLIYHDTTTVEPSLYQEGKYSVRSDGRATFEPEALLEIARHGLTVSRSFKVSEKTYPSVYSIFIASGAFVTALKEQFNLKKESIWITPIVVH